MTRQYSNDDMGSAFTPSPASLNNGSDPIGVWLQSKRRNRTKSFVKFILFCLLPTLCVFAYMEIWASPRYLSKSQFTYQTYAPTTSLASGLVQSVISGNQTSFIDPGSIIYEYVLSVPDLEKIDKKLNLRAHLSDPKIDYFSRMSPNADLNKFLGYFKRYVSISESEGGYLTLEVQAFDPDYAAQLSKAIVENCDEMLDNMTARARKDAVTAAQNEVKKTENRVLNARLALSRFQSQHGILNPEGSANQFGSIVGQLESERASLQARLALMKQTSPESPEISTTEKKLVATSAQILTERKVLANSEGNEAYSELLASYYSLQMEQEFAKNSYLAAEQGLAVAQADAAKQQSYLIDFSPPYRPDNSYSILPFIYALNVFLSTLAIFFIGSLMIASLRDQTG